MTICRFNLLNRETNGWCELELIENPGDQFFDFVSSEWSPALLESRDKARIAYQALPIEQKTQQSWQLLQAQFGAPDAHWDWRNKKDTMLTSANRMFALANNRSVEALALLDLSYPSPVGTSTSIVHVAYVAVAPWNRRPIQEPRFKGLGSVLIGVAVSISLEEEMEGRCGLHSLPQSEGFYHRLGMKDFGIVDSSGLKYFEFDPEGARKFLED